MNSLSSPESATWKHLYSAAMVENDRHKLPDLITQAEAAIVRRGRFLFTAPGEHLDERHALDHALDTLRALRRCLKSPDKVRYVA
jgi:hypothetical protein